MPVLFPLSVISSLFLSLSLSHSCSLFLSLSFSLSHTHTHTHTLSLSLSLSLPLSLSLSHSYLYPFFLYSSIHFHPPLSYSTSFFSFLPLAHLPPPLFLSFSVLCLVCLCI